MKKEDNANLPVPSFTKLQNIGLTAEDFDIKNENLRSRILIEEFCQRRKRLGRIIS